VGLGGWEVGGLSLGICPQEPPPSLSSHLISFRLDLHFFFPLSTFPRSLLLPGFVILIYSQILSSHELECKRGEIMGYVRWGAWLVVFLFLFLWVEEGLRG